jgi:phosphatidylinositol alpha-mannosyltransferase
MKIALITPYDFSCPGGVTTHINAVSQEFRARGHDVRIVAPVSADDATSSPHLIKATGSVLTVPYAGSNARISLSLCTYRRAKRLLMQEQFDVVHLHEPLTPTLPWAVLRHLDVSPKSLIVGTFHAYREVSRTYACGKPFFRRLMNRLDGRIAVSEAARDYVARYFPGEYVIIPNGIDLERFGGPQVRPLEPYLDGRLNVLFVGRLERRKGFEFLLRAFAHVQAALPETRLLVVGAFSPEDAAPYRTLSQELGLRHVEFVGPVSDDELPRYYRSGHLFCAPSIGYESFGLVLLEALAAGAPVVASDIRGYRTVLTDEQACLLAPPRDATALADAIIQLLRDPARREIIGRRGQALAQAYGWPRIADRLLHYYRWLRARQQSAPAGQIDEWEVGHVRG